MTRTSNVLFALATLCLIVICSGCPEPAGDAGIPEEVVRQNTFGTAYLGQQKWEEAEQAFRQALEQRPDDALLINNVAVALIQQGRIEEAEELLDRAVALDPGFAHALFNSGLIRKNAGDFEIAAARFEAVAAIDAEDLLTQYNLGVVLSRIGRDADAEAAFRKALKRDPSHVSTLYGLGRFLMQAGQQEEGVRLIAMSQEIRQRSGLDEAVGGGYDERGPYAMGADYDGATLAAPPEIPVEFREAARLEPTSDGKRGWVLTRLASDLQPSLLLFDERTIQRLDGDGPSDVLDVPASHALRALAAGDLDNDGIPELVAAVADGSGRVELKVLFQPFAWTDDPRFGSWQPSDRPEFLDLTIADLDHDGDVDIFYCWAEATAGDCLAGVNDGSGRFEVRDSEQLGLSLDPLRGPLGIGFSDLDNDRDIDLLVVDSQGARLLTNQRNGVFEEISARAGLDAFAGADSFEIADLNKDGWMDLVASAAAGPVWLRNLRGVFDEPAELGSTTGEGVVVIDFDNDGFLDVAHSADLLRNRGRGEWGDRNDALGTSTTGARPVTAFDADADGDLDLVVVQSDGAVSLLSNEGGNANGFISIENHGVGDNRFGIGSKVELLAGSLRQKFEVTDTLPLHAGLGHRERVDSIRHLWPGGVLQDEIDLAVGGAVEVTQLDRKGTSCPLLYAWSNGRWRFVTDFLGGCAIGYRHPSGVYSIPDTDEYVRIDGGLTDDDGILRLRVNNQLEEVIWFDKLELVVVDHPADAEVYPNERLMPAPPWPEFALFAGSDVRPVVAARDVADGRDLTEVLRESDRRYVDNFDLLPFKGYAESHTIELDLGRIPRNERIVLLLDGWIDYADSSSNLAAAQAGARLIPPRLLVADGQGGWQATDHRMGFPAGLPKTMTVDLTGLFPGDDHRLRIETTMRVYWDRARVMVGGRDTELRVRRLGPLTADLRFGGYPAPHSPDGRKPLGYDPENVLTTSSWKAHVGRYTAFGSVTGLLDEIDDRFVTTRHGDEIELHFPSPGALPEGWSRTYLLFADGFGKDMDPNSAAGDRVGPIPFHAMPAYPYGEGVVPPLAADDASSPPRIVGVSPRGWPGAPPQPAGKERGGS